MLLGLATQRHHAKQDPVSQQSQKIFLIRLLHKLLLGRVVLVNHLNKCLARVCLQDTGSDPTSYSLTLPPRTRTTEVDNTNKRTKPHAPAILSQTLFILIIRCWSAYDVVSTGGWCLGYRSSCRLFSPGPGGSCASPMTQHGADHA